MGNPVAGRRDPSCPPSLGPGNPAAGRSNSRLPSYPGRRGIPTAGGGAPGFPSHAGLSSGAMGSPAARRRDPTPGSPPGASRRRWVCRCSGYPLRSCLDCSRDTPLGIAHCQVRSLVALSPRSWHVREKGRSRPSCRKLGLSDLELNHRGPSP